MPQAAAAAVVSWLGVTGAAAAVVTAVVYVAVTVAINYGLTRISQSLAGKPKRDAARAGRDVTVRGTVEPMQMIYGEVRSPGFIAFFGTSGDQNRYLHFVVVYAAHQCEAITDIWMDGRHIPAIDIDGSGNVSTNAFTDGATSKLVARRFLGTKSQAADALLTAAFPGVWTANHRGAGVTYISYRLDYSEWVWATGAPSSFFALVRGKRVYDPRLDSTNGGAGAHRYNDATTWAWSRNWALCVRDYITGGSRWYDVATPEPRLGFGESNSRIADLFTIAAANISDEDVLIPPASPTTTQDRYTCDVQLSCGETYGENLAILKSAAAGNVTYVNGQYRIYAGAYDTPSVTINEDDILGPMTVVTHTAGDELYNLVTGTFYDENRDWQLSPFPNITNPSYETADGGQFPRKIELFATRSSYRAQRIGILILAQSRNKISARFERLSPKAMAISQHETFFVNCSEYGWTNKVFRCMEWEWMPDGFIALTAREESSATYADPSVGTYAPPDSSIVETPSFDLPATPLSFTARAMPEGILFRWDVSSPFRTDTVFKLYEHTAQSPFSSATEIWSGQDRSVLIQRSGYTVRYYWLVAELNGTQSAATPVGNGLAAAPSLQGFEETLYDSFDHQDYARFYDLDTGAPTVTYPLNGQDGGRVMRVQGKGQFVWNKIIPYDPATIYVMTVRARMVTAPSDSARDNFYAGVAGYASDGVTKIQANGASSGNVEHYFVANNFDFGSITLGQWRTFRGFLSGHSASPSPAPAPSISNPMEMYGSGGTVVRYIRPVLVFNVEDGNGIMEVDDIKLERVVYTDGLAPNAATAVNVTVEPADGSQAYSAATQPAVEVTGLNGVASYTSPTNVDTQVRVSWSGQARISNTTSGIAVGEAQLSVRVFINAVEVWSQYLGLEGYTAAGDWGNFSGQRDFAVPAGQAIDVYLQTGRSFSSSGSSPAQTMYWREALINLVAHLR